MPFDAANFVEIIPAPVVETEAQRILREARVILARPERWTQSGEYAEGAGENAAFCIYGAVMHAGGLSAAVIVEGQYDEGEYHDAEALRSRCPAVKAVDQYLEAAVKERTGDPIVITFNDAPTTAHDDVLSLLDRAYQLAAA